MIEIIVYLFSFLFYLVGFRVSYLMLKDLFTTNEVFTVGNHIFCLFISLFSWLGAVVAAIIYIIEYLENNDNMKKPYSQ